MSHFLGGAFLCYHYLVSFHYEVNNCKKKVDVADLDGLSSIFLFTYNTLLALLNFLIYYTRIHGESSSTGQVRFIDSLLSLR